HGATICTVDDLRLQNATIAIDFTSNIVGVGRHIASRCTSGVNLLARSVVKLGRARRLAARDSTWRRTMLSSRTFDSSRRTWRTEQASDRSSGRTRRVIDPMWPRNDGCSDNGVKTGSRPLMKFAAPINSANGSKPHLNEAARAADATRGLS